MDLSVHISFWTTKLKTVWMQTVFKHFHTGAFLSLQQHCSFVRIALFITAFHRGILTRNKLA